MKINNRFVYFEKLSDFDKQKNNISEYSIVFIKDPAMIWTHNTWYYCTPCPKKDSGINWFYNNEACDTLSIDILSNQEIILRNPHNLSPIEIETSGENDIVEIVNNVIRLPQNINTRKSGTVTVTATFAGNNEYEQCSVSCIINVTKSDYDEFEYNKHTCIVVKGQSYTLPQLPENLLLENITYQSSTEDVATIDEYGEVTIRNEGDTTITAFFGGNSLYNSKNTSYHLKVVPVTYYVGYYKGSNSYKNINEEYNMELLIQITDGGHNKLEKPQYVKEISVQEAHSSESLLDVLVLFVMWKEGNAPTGGSWNMGAGVERLKAEEFIDSSVFNIQRNVNDSNNITWHIAGLVTGFDEGNVITINFN